MPPACGRRNTRWSSWKFLAPALRKDGSHQDLGSGPQLQPLGPRDRRTERSGVYEAIDGIAWHGYVGEPSAMTRVHDAFPQRILLDRGRTRHQAARLPDRLGQLGRDFNGILNNWARSITAWNIALDEKGKPNIGPFSCGGSSRSRTTRTRSRAAANTRPSRTMRAT